MFAARGHEALITLALNEERLYKLPPMSNGPITIKAFDAYLTTGPHGEIVSHTGAAGDLEMELRHASHLRLPGRRVITAESLWHDDYWRLWVRRVQPGVVPPEQSEPRQFRIEAQYVSQLPILERKVPLAFFQEGFEANWNRQRYINVSLFDNRIQVKVDSELKQLYDLEDEYLFDTGRLSFKDTVEMESLRMGVGVGPMPPPLSHPGDAMFFFIRAQFPALTIHIDVPDAGTGTLGVDVDLPSSHLTARFYLWNIGESTDAPLEARSSPPVNLKYMATFDSNLLDHLNFDVPDPDLSEPTRTVNLRELVKRKIENALDKLQDPEQDPETEGREFKSRFGTFLAPWLIGGYNELHSLGYAPHPSDTRDGLGIIEPASGELIVRYVGAKPKPSTEPVIGPVDDGSTEPVDDGSTKLFDLPAEDPDTVPGGGGAPGDDGRTGPFGGASDIGSLAKIDHIVVLMQENRSFDQVLGYLSRDKINPEVDGLLPPDDPNHQKQFNQFGGRDFPSQKADRNDPPRDNATAWPSFDLSGPGHDTSHVHRQMDTDPETGLAMGGFVANFAERLGIQNPAEPLNASYLRLVMDYFGADDLGDYAVLAREFAISDRWYTSHAGPTWPNRFVLMTGDLNRDPSGDVEEDNPNVKTMIPIKTPTLFDHLTERGATWRVFEHGYSFLRLFRNFTFDITNIVPFDDPVCGFEAEALNGTLPQVTLIEPDYIDLPPGNDDHPPADMQHGQNLVRRIVQALIASPNWERTLCVITYDEHGGFYDHKLPPTDVPPLSNRRNIMGPRVPTFFISPLVERGKVFFGRADQTGRRFDHTSIGATILRRFAGPIPPKMSARLDAALDLREVLTLAEPRPRSEFTSLGLPPIVAGQAPARRERAERRDRIGKPKGNDDFHWVLKAVRLTTGEAPRVRTYQYVERSRPLNSPEAAGAPHGYLTPTPGVDNIVYRDTRGRLIELWRDAGGGTGYGDLTKAAQATTAAGDPYVYLDTTAGLQIVLYRGSDGNVHSLYWSTGNVGHDNLSGSVGAPKAAGDPVGYFTPAGNIHHVIYRKGDGNLHALWWTGQEAVSHSDVTGEAGALPAAGDPSAIIDTARGDNIIFYRASDGHIHSVYWSTGPFRHENLSGYAQAPQAAGDPFAFYTSHDDAKQVTYCGTDGHIHELWWGGTNPVSHWDLTAVSGAPAAAGDPVSFYSAHTNTKHVFYRATDGHLIELWWVPGGGIPAHVDIIVQALAPPAMDKPNAFVKGPNSHHVVYRGTDGQIHEIRWISNGGAERPIWAIGTNTGIYRWSEGN